MANFQDAIGIENGIVTMFTHTKQLSVPKLGVITFFCHEHLKKDHGKK